MSLKRLSSVWAVLHANVAYTATNAARLYFESL